MIMAKKNHIPARSLQKKGTRKLSNLVFFVQSPILQMQTLLYCSGREKGIIWYSEVVKH